MIKPLLLASAATIAITASAATPQAAPAKMTDSKAMVSKLKMPEVASSQKLADGVILNVENVNGIMRKTIKAAAIANKTINPIQGSRKAPARTPQSDATLAESFEGMPADADAMWLPDGWTRQTANAERPSHEQWQVSEAGMFMLPPSDGDKYAVISFSSDPQDEWIISPMVTVKEYDLLSVDLINDPMWYFDVMTGVDWNTSTWIEQKLAFTLQILIKEKDAQEWTTLKDFATDYMGVPFDELLNMSPTEMETYSTSLSEYVGKEVQIAIRYVGVDGNTTAIDNVRIAPPSLEPTYMMPFSSLYYGIDNSSEMSYLNLGIAAYPTNTPLTWENTSYNDAATYSWLYCDPTTSDWVTSNDQEKLTVTYQPDFSSEFTRRNNLYYAPILSASAPGASDGSYTASIKYLQAGGRAEYKFNDGTIAEYGLLPFNVVSDGMTIATADPEQFGGTYGDPGIPIFGYDKNVDKFWTYYTFRGEEADGDGVKLTHILNFIYAPDAPMVINGLWVDAKGKVGADAQLVAEILPLSEEGTIIEDKAIARATCKGSDIKVTEGGTQNYLSVPFKFDAPAVICSADYASYIVRISGFNDAANVEYFAPYQSYVPNADGLCHGWLQKAITYQGETRTSLSPIAYFDLGLGDAYNAFAINLDAYFPYISTEDLSVELNAGETKTVALGTYHDGSELTIEHDGPATISAAAAGRYHEALLTITDDGTSADAAEFKVKVSAPGIYKEINVSRTAGVESIIIDNDNPVVDVYNVAGQRMNAGQLPAGVYVVRRADGSSQLIRR